MHVLVNNISTTMAEAPNTDAVVPVFTAAQVVDLGCKIKTLHKVIAGQTAVIAILERTIEELQRCLDLARKEAATKDRLIALLEPTTDRAAKRARSE